MSTFTSINQSTNYYHIKYNQQEMESIFGHTSPSSIDNRSNRDNQEPDHLPKSAISHGSADASDPHLTHVDSRGEARMVDVSVKEDSKRVAKASCKVLLGQHVFGLVMANRISKGDVLNVAKIAGINGAKQTGYLIPMCHNIGLTHIAVDLSLNNKDHSVDVVGEAATTGKTGVEMEALTAVSIAGLTVYDMCKAASKDIEITDIRLDMKTGGKTGFWSRNQ